MVIEGETVLVFSKRVLGEKLVEKNGYVVLIDNQKEFDKKKDSRWIYRINNEMLKIPVNDYILKLNYKLEFDFKNQNIYFKS